MRIGYRFLFLASLCLTSVFADDDNNDEEEPDVETGGEIKEEDNVLVLTTSNFDEVINTRENVLVEFYAPWCGHCKSLAPEYAEAAKTLKDNDPPVTLGKVDATVEEELGSRFEVSGYPTLKVFKNGQPSDYDGPRQSAGIISYMKERADPNWKPPPEAVITLTDDNFDDIVNKEELILVEFYAPWCGHCKQLAPAYEKAAQQLKHHQPPIILAKVDATQQNELAKRFDVTGYPTLKIFRKGRPKNYDGERDQRGIVNYMISQAGEAAKPVPNQQALNNMIKDRDIIVVGFFDDVDDANARVYMDAANDLRDDFTFAISYDEATRNAYKVNPSSVIILNPEKFYTKYEPKWHVLHKKNLAVKDVVEFVQKYQVPLVGQYQLSMEKRYSKLRPLCLVFYTVDWSHDHREATQLWRNKIANIAQDYRDITFAVANEEDFDQLIKQFGLEDSPEEINIGIIGKDNKKYKMEPMEEFDSDEIKEFLEKFKKGKLSSEIRSQPIPKKQSGPVKVVVGKNFEEVVLDKTKDVLIEFYAPWCGHCKQLDPIYKKLAKQVKDQKNLVIAKIDATANDSPDNFKTEGFPTIYFATAKDKENPIKFEGKREIEDFEKFMREHATVSFGKSSKEEL
ncbi:protein disulfide-isomerase A4 [Patella vulgata]|uniref:protein disulfide-isomerase A4 n=1 Tax=Patella vulgata TaxID=6465 RepID=UPI00217F4D5E|nr:protein disulfide-isomerase A4 [Patella vulgata]